MNLEIPRHGQEALGLVLAHHQRDLLGFFDVIDLGRKIQSPQRHAEQEPEPGHDAVAIADARAYLKRSPDRATADEIRLFQLHLTETGLRERAQAQPAHAENPHQQLQAVRRQATEPSRANAISLPRSSLVRKPDRITRASKSAHPENTRNFSGLE